MFIGDKCMDLCKKISMYKIGMYMFVYNYMGVNNSQ